MSIIEIFRTDVQDQSEAACMVALLSSQFPGCRINFDLHDRDKILRLEGKDFQSELVRTLMQKEGYECVMLE